MKIDSTSLISSTLSDQVSSKKEEEKLESFTDAFEKAKESGDSDELKKVSQQFESFFINEIFKSMRKSSQWGEGLIEKSHARSMYESMMDEKLSDEISQGRGIGISDLIFKQMSKRYGVAEAVNSESGPDEKDNSGDAEEDPKTSLDIKG